MSIITIKSLHDCIRKNFSKEMLNMQLSYHSAEIKNDAVQYHKNHSKCYHKILLCTPKQKTNNLKRSIFPLLQCVSKFVC